MSKTEKEREYEPIGEELLRIARSRRIGTPRFRFPLTADEAYQVIGAFYVAEVERRGHECELNGFTLDKIRRLAEIVTAERPKFGILMTGKVGNGKTTLMQSFGAAAVYLKDCGVIKAEGFGFQYPGDFGMRTFTAKEIAQAAKNDWKLYENLKKTPMLALDELGEEPLEVLEYGNSISPITDLIEHRYNRQRFTMITTNLDPEEITQKYGVRISDRFREMLSVIPFRDFRSYRK